MASTFLPKIPEKLTDLALHLSKHPESPLVELLEPYKLYENKLREHFAQTPTNAALNDPHINTVPIFNDHTAKLRIRARDLTAEDDEQKERYIMPLTAAARKPNGSPAVVQSLKEFRDNFNVFSEVSAIQVLSELSSGKKASAVEFSARGSSTVSICVVRS
jgi:hypothetical protein